MAISLSLPNNNVNIAVDATCWKNNRGFGRHVRSLLGSLVDAAKDIHFTFVVDFDIDPSELPGGISIEYVKTDRPAAEAASATGNRSMVDMWKVSKVLSSGNFDLILFPTIYTYVPVITKARKIVIIHDIIPEKYPELTIPDRKARLFWRLKSRIGRYQADAIVTISDFSRDALIDHFNLEPEKVFVSGVASDSVFRVIDNPQLSDSLKAAGVPDYGRLLVYVGGFGPHKNLDSLVDSFIELANREGLSDLYLVMVGEYKQEIFYSQAEQLQDKIVAAGLSSRILFTGYLPDEDLTVLLNRATVLVLPSYMEGFGLPAIEAAACGCPVIATRESPLPGLMQDGAIFIDPFDHQELTDALQRVVTSPELRQNLRQNGLLAASQITWQKAASDLLAVIEKVGSS